MKDDFPELKTSDTPRPATAHGMTVATAFWLTLICGVITIGGTIAVRRNPVGTPARALLSLITLIALLGTTYSLVQLVLAIIGTAGERRWFTRQISERRQGDRARKPKLP